MERHERQRTPLDTDPFATSIALATARAVRHFARAALLQCSAVGFRVSVSFISLQKGHSVNNTYFGLLAEFGEANIPLAKVAPKYFGLSFEEARRRAPTQMLPCRFSAWADRNRPGSSVRPTSPN